MLVSILNVWLMVAAFASATSLDACLSLTGATLIYRGNTSAYADLSTPAVLGFDYHPAVLVLPTSAQQVARTVKCVGAEKGRSKLTIVGGGHNYVGYSYSGDVVILSNNMTDITFDDTKKQVSVQFGQKLGPLAKALAAKGYGLPHGLCPSVGVAGHSLGGGWGFTGRHWGWLVDHSMQCFDLHVIMLVLTTCLG